MQAAAPALGVRLLSVPVQHPDEFEAAFATARRGSDAMMVAGGELTNNHRLQIIQFGAQHRLPTIYAFREFVAGGGLMSYGPDILGMFRRSASFMDKILKGAKPSDLPVEQPTSFDLVINAKTAAELGITLPESLNVRVTEVIR